MDPEVHQDHPGACPKCGMALEAAVPAALATRTEYTCPMHPEIVRSGPGACPICGMALEPRTTLVEGGKSGACLDDATLLDQRSSHSSRAAARNVRLDSRSFHSSTAFDAVDELDRVSSGNACCALGWFPFLSTRLGFDRQSQPEYVHVDRDWHGNSLRLQHHRQILFPQRSSPASSFRDEATKSLCISRPQPLSPLWCCSAKCSN